MTAAPDLLLDRLARRERLACAGRRAAWAAAAAGGGLALAVAVGRLLGHGGWTRDPWLAAVPAAAALLAAATARRVPAALAAGLADRSLGTRDLFRTWLALDAAPGAFHAVVRQQAAAAAAPAAAERLRPFRPWRPLAWAGGGAALAVLALLAAPERDPFGAAARRERRSQLAQAIAADRAATQLRLAELRAAPAATHAAATSAALQRLEQAIARFGPGAPKAQAPLLIRAQQDLGQALAQARSAAVPPGDGQRLGDSAQTQALREALAQGDGKPMAAELARLADLARRLEASRDPAEGRTLAQELGSGLEELARAAGRRGGGEALRRAAQQAALAQDPALRAEASAAVAEALEQAGLEMARAAEAGRDRQALEEALDTLRLARQLDAAGALPRGDRMTLDEYRRAVQALAQGQAAGDGDGQGMGPQAGQGQGGIARENEAAQTGFVDERSPGELRPGQVLMSWSAAGAQHSGEAKARFERAQASARQEAAEALEREDLPPGAAEAVRRYFDAMK